MRFPKLGLSLKFEDLTDDTNYAEIFGLTPERADFLDTRRKVGESIIGNEKDLQKGFEYFLNECSHPNEASYCLFRLGQSCNCKSMAKVLSITGSVSDNLPPELEKILQNIFGKA